MPTIEFPTGSFSWLHGKVVDGQPARFDHFEVGLFYLQILRPLARGRQLDEFRLLPTGGLLCGVLLLLIPISAVASRARSRNDTAILGSITPAVAAPATAGFSQS